MSGRCVELCDTSALVTRGPSERSRIGRGHLWSCNGTQKSHERMVETRESSIAPKYPRFAATTCSPAQETSLQPPRETPSLLSSPRAAGGGSSHVLLHPTLPHTHPVAMKPPCGKYMQHRPLVMGANATGDRISNAQILSSLRREGGDTMADPQPPAPAAEVKPLGIPLWERIFIPWA